MSDNKQTQQQIKEIAKIWSNMPAGVRPEQVDLAVYQQVFDNWNVNIEQDSLLLGATPELRDVLMRYPLRRTACDIDDTFWQAMTTLLTEQGTETFIHSNWLDMPETQQYEWIVGDCALNMLTWPEMQALVAKLQRLLKPTGQMCLRVQSINPQLNLEHSLPEAIQAYSGEKTERGFLMYLHCLTESLRNAHAPEQNRREFYEQVVAQYLTDEEMTSLRPLLRERRNCYPPRAALQQLFKEHFCIVKQEPSQATGSWGTAEFYVLAHQ